MILEVSSSGARVEAEIVLGSESGFDPWYRVVIEGRVYTPADLRLFVIAEATPAERVKLALGLYDLRDVDP